MPLGKPFRRPVEMEIRNTLGSVTRADAAEPLSVRVSNFFSLQRAASGAGSAAGMERRGGGGAGRGWDEGEGGGGWARATLEVRAVFLCCGDGDGGGGGGDLVVVGAGAGDGGIFFSFLRWTPNGPAGETNSDSTKQSAIPVTDE